jgi:capsule polysaccharide export protein KpsE/RkpR
MMKRKPQGMRSIQHEIPGPLQTTDILSQLISRWRIVAVACTAAVLIAIVVSLVLPPQYTATCRVLVDPPAGSDPRVSTAVSPIYLESLRTYEAFASSDDLFLQASRKFGLRTGSTPIERLKKRILHVQVLRNTKLLEISATLGEPTRAHELALYIAREAVNLNRSVGVASDRELIEQSEKEVTEARLAFDRAQQAWEEAVVKGPVAQLDAQMESDVELRSKLQGELVAAEADVAELEASPASRAADEDLRAPRARVAKLRAGVQKLEETIAQEQAVSAERKTRAERLEVQRKSAESMLRASETRLRDARANTGYRGERLTIIDPGIVPERPSAPNIPLNVAAAAFAAFVLSVLFILLQASYRTPRSPYD